jgi:hypothetical protein
MPVDVEFLFIRSVLSCFSGCSPNNLVFVAGVGDNFN